MKTLQLTDGRHYKLKTFHGNQYVKVETKKKTIPTWKLVVIAIVMTVAITARLMIPLQTEIISPLPTNLTLK